MKILATSIIALILAVQPAYGSRHRSCDSPYSELSCSEEQSAQLIGAVIFWSLVGGLIYALNKDSDKATKSFAAGFAPKMAPKPDSVRAAINRARNGRRGY